MEILIGTDNLHHRRKQTTIKDLKRKQIYAITSVPCFEYWLLLHYLDSSKPYKAAGKDSAGDKLENELKSYIPNYYKGHKSIFEITKPYLNTAIDRAKKINAQQKRADTDNPSTKMHELIERLLSLKKDQQV